MTQIYRTYSEQKNIFVTFLQKNNKKPPFNKGGSISKFQFY